MLDGPMEPVQSEVLVNFRAVLERAECFEKASSFLRDLEQWCTQNGYGFNVEGVETAFGDTGGDEGA